MNRSNHAILSFAVVLFLATGAGCSKQDVPVHSDVDYYTCPMHPSVHESKQVPCPICGMDLVPVKKKRQNTEKLDSGTASASVPDLVNSNSIQIAPERLQAIGVRTGVVKKQVLQTILRAPGTVMVDESTLRDINVKTADGFIEKLLADSTGRTVHKGETLAWILSEGWIEAQQEYIKAYRAWRRSNVLSTSANSVALEQEFNRMRARLRVWDLSEAQLKKLEDMAINLPEVNLSLRKGQGQGLSGIFELLSPIDGIVLQKEAVQGMKFTAGQSLFRLAQLTPVWVEAEFHEDQAPYVAPGNEFDITFPALPDMKFKARVSYIYPQVNAETRRLKARFILPNTDLKLLPGMYANVSYEVQYGEKLAVPFDAVIPTGDRFVVFLDQGGGRLEPRFVSIGEKLGNSYEVLDGLKEGDRVITSANFLIDSESRIQGVLKQWSSDVAPTGQGH